MGLVYHDITGHLTCVQVVEEMEGQGVSPNHQTIFLGLTAAAERGDPYVAGRLLAYARARGIELDKRWVGWREGG